MIHYVFDLDDTLIIHQKGVNLDYNMIKVDKLLKQLLDNCNNECYIYTNGTFGHALAVIKKMDINVPSKPVVKRRGSLSNLGKK